MNNIQVSNKTLTSMEVASMVVKQHKELLKDIRKYISNLNEGEIAPVDFFLESSYIDKKGEERPCYLITKKGCEFIANKLTGKKGTLFTASYINKFHEMEEIITRPQIMSPVKLLELQLEAMKQVDDKVIKLQNDFKEFKDDMPLLALEIERIQKAKNIIAVSILGGKEKPAYKDKSTRGKLYTDISRELKRQFNVDTYKALKRNEVDKAIKVIESYKAPLYLIDEINIKNGADNIENISML